MIANIVETTRRLMNLDGWANILTQVGVRGKDPRLESGPGGIRVPNRLEALALYLGNDVAKRIVDEHVETTWRDGFTVDTGDDALSARVNEWIENWEISNRLSELDKWSRVYGGAVLFIGATSPDDITHEPLDYRSVREFSGFKVADRWEASATRYDGDARPVSVHILDHVYHNTWYIQQDGIDVGRQARLLYTHGWGLSIYAPMWDALRAFGTAWDGTESVVNRFNQAILRMRGLASLMAQNGEDAIMQRLVIARQAMSSLGVMLLDSDNEDFIVRSSVVTGLPELLDRFESRLAAAADMPHTMLFGKSPAGMNATGESDIRTWYDSVANQRSERAEPVIRQLIDRVAQSPAGPSAGAPLENYEIVWQPLWRPSAKEEAETYEIRARGDEIYARSAIFDVTEIAESRRDGREGTAIMADDKLRVLNARVSQTTLSDQATTGRDNEPPATLEPGSVA